MKHWIGTLFLVLSCMKILTGQVPIVSVPRDDERKWVIDFDEKTNKIRQLVYSRFVYAARFAIKYRHYNQTFYGKPLQQVSIPILDSIKQNLELFKELDSGGGRRNHPINVLLDTYDLVIRAYFDWSSRANRRDIEGFDRAVHGSCGFWPNELFPDLNFHLAWLNRSLKLRNHCLSRLDSAHVHLAGRKFDQALAELSQLKDVRAIEHAWFQEVMDGPQANSDREGKRQDILRVRDLLSGEISKIAAIAGEQANQINVLSSEFQLIQDARKGFSPERVSDRLKNLDRLESLQHTSPRAGQYQPELGALIRASRTEVRAILDQVQSCTNPYPPSGPFGMISAVDEQKIQDSLRAMTLVQNIGADGLRIIQNRQIGDEAQAAKVKAGLECIQTFRRILETHKQLQAQKKELEARREREQLEAERARENAERIAKRVRAGGDYPGVAGYQWYDLGKGESDNEKTLILKILGRSIVRVKDRIGLVKDLTMLTCLAEFQDLPTYKEILEIVVVKTYKKQDKNSDQSWTWDDGRNFITGKKYLFMSNRTGSAIAYYPTVEELPHTEMIAWKRYKGANDRKGYIIGGQIVVLRRADGAVEINH